MTVTETAHPQNYSNSPDQSVLHVIADPEGMAAITIDMLGKPMSSDAGAHVLWRISGGDHDAPVAQADRTFGGEDPIVVLHVTEGSQDTYLVEAGFDDDADGDLGSAEIRRSMSVIVLPEPQISMTRLTPLYISADTDWSGLPAGAQEARFQVSLQSQHYPDYVWDYIDVASHVRPDSHGNKPGDGNTAHDPASRDIWVYRAYKEGKTVLNPTEHLVFMLPSYKGTVQGDWAPGNHFDPWYGDAAYCRANTVFRYLTDQLNDNGKALNYVLWKYDHIPTGNANSITYNPSLQSDGNTNFVTKNVTLGPRAFGQGENVVASTIGHENVHAGQDWVVFFDETAAEIEAYMWEVFNSPATGLSSSELLYVQQMLHWYQTGKQGPKPAR
jgi:hypothetical protein